MYYLNGDNSKREIYYTDNRVGSTNKIATLKKARGVSYADFYALINEITKGNRAKDKDKSKKLDE